MFAAARCSAVQDVGARKGNVDLERSTLVESLCEEKQDGGQASNWMCEGVEVAFRQQGQ